MSRFAPGFSKHFFSVYEKSLLTEFVMEYKDILENKKNDSKSIELKNSTWNLLAEQFNSQVGVQTRDCKQLRKCWENIKSRAKRLSKEQSEIQSCSLPVIPVVPVDDDGTSPMCDKPEAEAGIIQDPMDSFLNVLDDHNFKFKTGKFHVILICPSLFFGNLNIAE